MPLTEAGIYYADTSTNMSIADITAAMATSMGEALTILQVVSTSYNTPVSNSTITFVDTGLSATITPISATSKILVLVSQNGLHKTSGSTGHGVHLRILRGGTEIQLFANSYGYDGVAINRYIGGASAMILDSPNTTAAVTYKTQFKNDTNASNVSVQISNATSTITLVEIAA